MSVERHSTSEPGALDQLVGFTGVGWTASVLGYLWAGFGVGDGPVTRLVADPQPLLYLGIVLFVATVGLDRLRTARSEGER